jgi:isopenicillin N synthase-like dioxygenase
MNAPAGSVPVIDLSGFVDADQRRRRALGDQIDRACREVGFFTVVGHGVDDATIEALRTAARAFFDAPLEDRLAVAMPEPGYPYGYNPLQAEALNRSIGGAAPADLKETFNVGPIDPPPRPLGEMADPDERAVYSPNLWPAAVPSLRPAVEAYYRSMAGLAATLMESFAVALGLDDRVFDDLIDAHGSALRLAHYPALDDVPTPGQFRAGAHTDYGTLTILWTDGEPGLQVLTDRGWIDVEPVEGGLIVNLGDLMARWTNDRWRSTMHRVVADGRSESRLSIPFFHNANWDATVECIVADGEAPAYPPITAGRHLMEKFRSTVM